MSSEASRRSSSCLTAEQQQAITRLYEGNTLLVAQMGAGKTIIAASAITELLDDNELTKILILTTPKIANTVWRQEFAAWEHTHHIKVAVATGAPEQRKAAMLSDAQVVVATFNVLPWIKENKLFAPFDGLLIDETTKLKTPGGAQFKALRKALKQFKWRAGLTGTPVSEDFMALYAQCMLIDCGAALGTRFDRFKDTYFIQTDYKGYNHELREGAATQLLDAVAPLVYVMGDYRHTLPPIEYINHAFTLDQTTHDYYNRMRKDMVTEHAKSANQAVLVGKLQQIANGFVYQEDGTAKTLSTQRLDVLLNLRNRLQGNVIIVYWFQHDLDQIKQRIPDAVELTPASLVKTVKSWNEDRISTLLLHSKSAGHGIQLEQGGHQMIWYGPQWSRDLWEQTNARLWRRGQKHPVQIHTITAKNTIDEIINRRVESKAAFDELFTQHLKRG